jgi:CO/xanthine dehydrogenase FAD-binding subunit
MHNDMLCPMKPAPFRYVAVESVDEVLATLAEHGPEAKILAGGLSLVPLLNLRSLRPAVVVDVNRVQGLDTLEARGGAFAIGALVRHRTLEQSDSAERHAPLLVGAVRLVADAWLRGRGTVGGSLAYANPAAELPAAVLALDASVTARSARGERSVPARELFRGRMESGLEPDELLTEVQVPAVGGAWGFAFDEVSRRWALAATVAVAAGVRLEQDGSIAEVRVAVAGVADVPLRLRQLEQELVGERPTPETLRTAAENAALELDPPGDVLASAAYRKRVTAVVVRRSLERAAAGVEVVA